MKVCKKCGKELPDSAFHKNSLAKDGLASVCKGCVNEYCHQHYYKKLNKQVVERKKKVCTNCKRELPLKFFYKSKYSSDGFKHKCKDCCKEYNKNHPQKRTQQKSESTQQVIPTRQCPRCGKMLPLTSFYPNKTRKDGLQVWCKDCQLEYTRQQNKKRQQVKQEKPQHIRHLQIENVERIIYKPAPTFSSSIASGIQRLFKVFANKEKELKVPREKIVSITMNDKVLNIKYKK